MLDADRIRLCRLKLRLSQQRLGDLVGQDQAYISRLERGWITDITVRTLERLADVFGETTDYLLGRETERQALYRLHRPFRPRSESEPAPPPAPRQRPRKAAAVG